MSKGSNIAKCVWTIMVVTLFALFISAGRTQGQAETATISGTATDASGGALAGAKVDATNVATNVSQSTTTDSAGRYRISSLPVGTYSVQASLSGFQTVVHTGVTLAIGGAVVVDFSMPVGQVTTTVSVESEVSRVETSSSEISTLVSPQQIRELPLNGRNFTQLLTLAPGVTTVPASVNTANFVVGRMYGAMDNYSVSGSRPTGQMFLMDNVDIRDFWEHSTGSGYGGTNLGVEGIGEFQVLTNTYNAQFAGNGVVMNAATRSGSNDLHGGAYEYFRNRVLDAASLSDKNAIAEAATYGVKLQGPPPFRRNQFGGALGGAIKKDKLFFFGNYEGLRQGLDTTIVPIYLPMGYITNGQIPCSTAAAGYNGCPAAPAGTPGSAGNPLVTVTPFGGSALAAANVDRMTNIMRLYSLCKTCFPNTPPPTGSAADAGGFYTASEQSILNVNEDYALGRVDYNLSSKDSMFARYVFDNAKVDDPRDPMGIFPETDHTRNQFLVITERHVVSSTMVNSVRFGYTRVKEASTPPLHLSAAQLKAANLTGPVFGPAACPDTSYVPTCDPLNFVAADAAVAGSGYTNQDVKFRADVSLGGMGPGFPFTYPGLGPDADRPDSLIQSKFSGGDDLVFTHGSHSLKIGGVVQRVDTNNAQLAYSSGQSYLGWSTPGGPFSPTGLQGTMQGLGNFGFEVVPQFYDSTRYFREIGLAPYIQDDWKITRKLTLNLGIRYDYFTNPVGWSPEGPLTQVPGSFLVPIGPQAPAPDCSGVPVTTNTVALAQCLLGIYTPVKHVFASNPNAANWAPRIGFAFDPFSDHKTSIRGGFGIFHDPVAARIYESGIVFTPPASSITVNNGSPFANPVNDPCLPDPFALVAGYCGYPAVQPGEFAAVSYQVPNGSPYVMQYNLSVQREILRGTVLSVGYVGSAARHMWMQRDENPPQCDTFPNCSAVPAPTLAGENTGAHFTAGNPRVSANFGPRVMEATTTSSGYNSVQVSLSRQFAHNLAGQVNYSYSHCIDDGSFATSLEFWGQLMTDPYNQRYDYGNCNFDIRHNLVANALYSLPFKGNRLVEGWQVTTIVSFNTGAPTNVTNSTIPGFDPSNLGAQWATRPNYTFATSGPILFQGVSGTNNCGFNQMLNKWTTVTDPTTGAQLKEYAAFNANCYAAQASGYVGNVKRNSIPGLLFSNFDFSILKNTKITEKLNVQFRAEFFNIFNHINPGAPTSIIFPFGPSAFPMGNSVSSLNNPRQIQFALKLDF